MNIKLKAGLVMGLAAAAAVMAVLAVSSVAAPEDEIPDYYIEGTVSPQQAEYVKQAHSVWDCDGYIGVYASAQAPAPEDITDIPTANLRPADRKLLARGIPVSNRSELLTLLEDFGS